MHILGIILFTILAHCMARHPVHVKVGAIFNEIAEDDEYRQAFEAAIAELQEVYDGVFEFEPLIKLDVPMDALKVFKATCALIEEGATIIFGPKHADYRKITSNVADRLKIPHVMYSFMKEDDKIQPSTLRFNAYPNAKSHDWAIAKAERLISWNTYTYIYQTHAALSRIVRALPKTQADQRIIAFRKLPDLDIIMKEKDEELRHIYYEKLVKLLVKDGHSTLLIDVQRENLRELLETIRDQGLMTDYFMCLLSNMDSGLVSLDGINTRDTASNITFFRLVKEDSPYKSVEASILYDAVLAYGVVIESLNKYFGHRKLNEYLKSDLGSCDTKDAYGFGQNISDMYRRKVRYGKYTGLMKFDEFGKRDFEMEMVNAQAGKTSVIGTWKDGEWSLTRNENDMNDTLSLAIQNKIFKVTTKVGAPYLMLAEDQSKGRIIGEKRYEGFVVDLFEEIEEYLKIKTEFYLVPDKNHGSKDPKTKKWNGLVGELLDLKADFAICDLTITSERQSAVDFTAPFMNLGISILFSKSEKQTPDLFAFLSPLSIEVWFYMATATLIISLVLFLQVRMAPDEWINPHPCKEATELEVSFTLTTTFWLTIGSLMQQGCDILPRATSVRLSVTFWWFFILIVIQSYIANLAAVLTAVKQEITINNINDLAAQTKINYGCMINGSTYSFFKNSNTSMYQKIFTTMTDTKPTVFTKSNDEGVDRVINGKKKYAFLMESTSIEYQSERHCELQQVGSLLDNKGYGIALPPNSPYRTMMNTAILYLQEKSRLQMLKDKWWIEKGGGKCKDAVSDTGDSGGGMDMPQVGGVFLVLVSGSILSVFVGIIEFLWNIRKIAIENKVTPWEALKDEMRFIVNVKLDTKPVAQSLD